MDGENVHKVSGVRLNGCEHESNTNNSIDKTVFNNHHLVWSRGNSWLKTLALEYGKRLISDSP